MNRRKIRLLMFGTQEEFDSHKDEQRFQGFQEVTPCKLYINSENHLCIVVPKNWMEYLENRAKIMPTN